MKRAAEAAGAPAGSVDAISQLDPEATSELMAQQRRTLILATGGEGMVRAAYASGTPTISGGPVTARRLSNAAPISPRGERYHHQ